MMHGCPQQSGQKVNSPARQLYVAPLYELPDETALAALILAAQTKFRRHKSFAGFAVFADWWHAASVWKPAPEATQWPRGTGIWYSNHSMILDPNTTTRDALFAWARSRGVTEIYMAPHSMPALIEGSSGGDYSTMARLCEFLEIGSRFGVDVQLFSNLFANDAWFMRNCSSSLL